MALKHWSKYVCVTILCILALTSCQERERWIGKYETTILRNHDISVILLELKPDGTGSLATKEDNVLIKWETSGDAIWIHTKSGGVIVGKMRGRFIELHLPGIGDRQFMKLKR